MGNSTSQVTPIIVSATPNTATSPIDVSAKREKALLVMIPVRMLIEYGLYGYYSIVKTPDCYEFIFRQPFKEFENNPAFLKIIGKVTKIPLTVDFSYWYFEQGINIHKILKFIV
jgi:hypothetical protein